MSAKRALQFMDDLENIRSMARASEIIFASDKHDLEISGGDGSKLGTTAAERAAKKQFDDFTQAAMHAIRAFNGLRRPLACASTWR